MRLWPLRTLNTPHCPTRERCDARGPASCVHTDYADEARPQRHCGPAGRADSVVARDRNVYCDSQASAGARTKAVVPSRGRARSDLGDCDRPPLPDVAEIPTTAFCESARPSGRSPPRQSPSSTLTLGITRSERAASALLEIDQGVGAYAQVSTRSCIRRRPAALLSAHCTSERRSKPTPASEISGFPDQRGECWWRLPCIHEVALLGVSGRDDGVGGLWDAPPLVANCEARAAVHFETCLRSRAGMATVRRGVAPTLRERQHRPARSAARSFRNWARRSSIRPGEC
jgi:hypothetical protein